jgi:hypothetical protein
MKSIWLERRLEVKVYLSWPESILGDESCRLQAPRRLLALNPWRKIAT